MKRIKELKTKKIYGNNLKHTVLDFERAAGSRHSPAAAILSTCHSPCGRFLQQLPSAGNSPLLRSMSKLSAHRDDDAYCEHLLANYEVEAEKELGRSRTFIKLGPMLGLMGTLIPMGPALVGLAQGDISSMAYNMQVAFATTVVGLVIAAVGIITLQSDKPPNGRKGITD